MAVLFSMLVVQCVWNHLINIIIEKSRDLQFAHE